MIKPPVFNLKRIFTLRNKIYEALRPVTIGIELQGEELRMFADKACMVIPCQVPEITMFESVRGFDRQVMTDALLRSFSWRLAANLPALRTGSPVVPWHSPGREEWVPVQVMRVEATRHAKTKASQAMFTLRILAGTAAGLEIQKPFKPKSLPVIAKSIGFTNRRGRYRYRSFRHFVNLRFLVKLDPAKATETAPSFFHIHGAKNLETYNRRLLAVRLRRKPCPRGYPGMCETCAVGYVNCEFATHRLDLARVQCSRCNLPGWADPEL